MAYSALHDNSVGGRVAQVVNTSASGVADSTSGSAPNIPDDNSKPTWAEVFNFSDLDTTITPTASGNKIRIDVSLNWGMAGTEPMGAICLFEEPSGTDECLQIGGLGYSKDTGDINSKTLTHYMAASGTFPSTFKVGVGTIGASNHVYINQNGTGTDKFNTAMISSMTITEIGPGTIMASGAAVYYG